MSLGGQAQTIPRAMHPILEGSEVFVADCEWGWYLHGSQLDKSYTDLACPYNSQGSQAFPGPLLILLSLHTMIS